MAKKAWTCKCGSRADMMSGCHAAHQYIKDRICKTKPMSKKPKCLDDTGR